MHFCYSQDTLYNCNLIIIVFVILIYVDLQVEPIIQDCDYGGFVYEHGSTFHPSDDEENITNPYCSSCSCNVGL